MARLKPEYRDLIEYLKQRRLQEREEQLPELREKLTERYGQAAPEVAAGERESLEQVLRDIAGTRKKMGVKQLGREQSLEDVKAKRKYKKKMTFGEWAQRDKELTKRIQGKKELQELAGEQAMARQKQKQKWKEGQAEKSRKRNLLKNLLKTGISMATGGVAGMLMPKIMGAKKGQQGQGFLRGAVSGLPGVAYGVMSQMGMYQQPQGRTQTQTQQPQASPIQNLGFSQTSNYPQMSRMGMQGFGGTTPVGPRRNEDLLKRIGITL